uniref:RC217 n=1 Tax=Ruegeria sp. PR1b TaxID=185588 RepID=Q8KVX3_9RHOB|nr:aldehyde dehydrogenase [Ruegeria sp. PR1b]AAN05290.1 RC217 [Ruegeria sp. PR1b]
MNAASFTKSFWHDEAKKLEFRTKHLINGEWVDSEDGTTFDTINPATGETIAKVASGKAADIDKAVKNARETFKSGVWSMLAPRERLAVIERFSALIEENAVEFALLDCLDMGKPVMDMINIDIPESVKNLKFFAETADKVHGSLTATDPSVVHYILRQPLGVVGLITPWNYPLMMAAWKLGPALITGNSVVLKPAEQAPLSCALLGDLFLKAGGPAGVLNVVQGLGEEAGKAIGLHPDVDKIGFTGSTEVGKLLMTYAGQSNMKRVTTECGGKTPQIVFADYDNLDKAVTSAVYGIYGNMGEMCNAGSRILVQRPIYDEFIKRFSELTASNMVVGDPLDPDTTIGPLVTVEQQERVLEYIEIGKKEGATLALGGGRGLNSGCYVEPTLFTDVTNSMRVAQEEIFGPVGTVIPFDTAEEALEIANDSLYGLAAAVWTNDLKTAHRFGRDLESGFVWVNTFDIGDMTSIWGGYKQSGNGRDTCIEALSQYTQTKSVWMDMA